MMDLQVWNWRREEMMREAEQNRLAKALRGSRRRRGLGWAQFLAWEFGRHVGRLRKLLKSLTKNDHERRKVKR